MASSLCVVSNSIVLKRSHTFINLQFHIINGKSIARNISRGNRRMYSKHVSSWILCYDGTHKNYAYTEKYIILLIMSKYDAEYIFF